MYQHFQDCKKVCKTNIRSTTYQSDSNLYPWVNNNIEYGLFEDIVNLATILTVRLRMIFHVQKLVVIISIQMTHQT